MLRRICMAPEGADGGGAGGTPPPGNAADPLKNIKAEFDRKLDGQTQAIAQLQETTKALLQTLQAKAPPANPQPANTPKKKFGDRIYDDPNGAADDLLLEAEERILGKLQKAGEASTKEQQIVANLRSDYPELWDVNSELATKAIELFSKLPADERIPAMYKTCVKDAAEELNILPKKKRPAGSNNDDFTMGQGGRGGAGGGQSPKASLDEKTLAFARAVGLNVEDPKVVDSIKSRQRSAGEWLQYRG